MRIGETQVEDTFAEAFGLRFTRLVVTAADPYWLDAALREFIGYSASVIACDAEIGLERRLTGDETPDGRCGGAVLVFGMSTDALSKAVPNRVGQCFMTSPSSAVYNGLAEAPEKIPLGKQIRFFGDGYQKSKGLDGRRYSVPEIFDGPVVWHGVIPDDEIDGAELRTEIRLSEVISAVMDVAGVRAVQDMVTWL